MKLLRAELKKITTAKPIVFLLVFLLGLNFILTLYTARPQPYEKTVREVYAQYLETPEELDTYYLDLRRLMSFFIREDPELPHTFYGSAEHDDLSILMNVKSRNDYLTAGWSEQIQRITTMTRRKLDNLYGFEYPEDSYEVLSQQQILNTYQNLLKEVNPGTEYAYGYDVYLKNNTVSLFILLFLLAAVSYLFLSDRSVGFEPVLRISKRGCGATFAAKLAVTLLLTIGGTLLFLSTTFLATGIRQGYSSLFTPIQAFPVFATVPYRTSVLEYLLLHTAFRLVGFTVFSLLVAALASARLPYVLCFGGGAGFYALNRMFVTREYIGTLPPIRYINLDATVEACDLTGFYRVLPLFGYPVSYPVAVLLLSALLCAAFAALGTVCYCRNLRFPESAARRLTEFSNLCKTRLASLGTRLRGKRRPCRRLPLFVYELKKTHVWASLLLILLLLCAKETYTRNEVGTMASYNQALYYEYITQLQPLAPEERAAAVAEERARLNAILDVAEQKRTALLNGSMEMTEYYDYYRDLTDAQARDTVFENVESYVSYITAKNAETGLDGALIYSTGYEKLVALPGDIFLYVALIVLCFRVFSVEYMSGTSHGGFVQILRTTKKGRRNTFAAKLGIYLLLGTVTALAFRAVTVGTVADCYLLSDMDATLYSVRAFSAVTSGITVRQYLILDFALQMLVGAVVAGMICIISFACKKPLAILSVTVLAIGFPELLTRSVLKSCADFSILSLSSPRAILCNSALHRRLGGDFGYLLLICLLYAAVATAVILLAQKRYCDHNGRGRKT